MHPLRLFLCCLKVQNMLEHGKKGICLSDSDMFQHFPTGSRTSQNNCKPGSGPLAYDDACIMLQESGQTGHTHGAAGMHSPERSPCWTAGLGTEEEQHREHNRKKYGLTRTIQTTERGWGHARFIDRRKRPRERKQLAQTYTCEDYKRKLVGEMALNSSTNNTDL